MIAAVSGESPGPHRTRLTSPLAPFHLMANRSLPLSPTHDRDGRRAVGFGLAQLEDLHERLAKTLTPLDVAALEWQPAPGRNTVGMLAAHIGLVEVYWLQVAPSGVESKADADRILRDVTGIGGDDDGMPAPKDARHPEAIRGWTAPDYLRVLSRALDATRKTLSTWTDADLARVIVVPPGNQISLGWILHHCAEHLAYHWGQISLVLRAMRDQV
jgi:uncharacterized damage-inducible protein DinB